jgi:2-aminoadipate transaminase
VEALQYGPVQGTKDLREVIVKYLLNPKGMKAEAENIMVTSGGMETINLLCQLFIEKDDVILVESPSFIHTIEVFEMFQAKCIPVAMDNDGMMVDELEEKIREYQPKMVYVIPTFHNPTGRTLSVERRRRIAELGSQYDVLILEDDPYRDIRYFGEDLPTIKSFDKTNHTILANSFSKIFSAGLRLGYIWAEAEVISKLCDAKSATNSHTSMLPQILCAEFFNQGYYEEHLKKLVALYSVRRDTMMRCLREYFPEGTKWTEPDGGLFTWVQLPEGMNSAELLKMAVQPPYKVAFVSGEGFFAEKGGKGADCMRLSFGSNRPELIEEGMKRLGDLVRDRL